MLKKIIPRKYQEEIVETCKEKNCLVVLPTGIGKTLIALMLVLDRTKKFPEQKILLLAPTRPLAQQHLSYFKKHLPELYAEMNLFTGEVKAPQRKKIWQTSDIIFSTPQCIANDLKNGLYNLEAVSLLIEDEAHRCLKNYSYRYVAEKYKQQSQNPKILGLTASPGADKSRIKEICKNLGIEDIELRTRESEDVKPYLQELKFDIVKLDFPEKFASIRENLRNIYNKKVEELKNRRLLYGYATKTSLLELQKRIMTSIIKGNKNFNLLSGASACAQTIKLQHALELLESQTLTSLEKYFYDLFDQAKQAKSKAVQQLVKNPEFNKAYTKLIELKSKNIEHPKLAKIKELIEEEISKNPKAKIIVFSQYRESVSKICKEANSIQGILARVFVGQLKKGEMGLSQKEQQALLEEFSRGKVNVLCATSIGEEGLDIPEVNAVIFYEPVPSAIRKIQRAGRTARLVPGRLIILVTQKTIDEAYYWAAFHKEKRMHKAIDSIKEEMKNNSENQEKQKGLF